MARPTLRDSEEFCEFVTARSAALFRVAYLILGDYQLAQDLVQESLAKTYVAWPRLNEVGNAEARSRLCRRASIRRAVAVLTPRRGMRDEPESTQRGSLAY